MRKFSCINKVQSILDPTTLEDRTNETDEIKGKISS
jgi:hypothetical protein